MGKIDLKNSKEISVKKGLSKFIRHCKIKNLSEYTVNYYKNCYNYLIKFLEDDLGETDDMLARKIDSDMIGEFTLWLVENYNMRDTTINSRIRGVRAYLYYLMEKGYVNDFKVNTRSSQEIPKEVYSDKELEKLLKKPSLNDTNFADYRNWVIVNFLLATAARARTLRNIKVKDVFIDEAVVSFCKVKNKKQQIIPLSKSLTEILEEYLDIRDGDQEDYLFCNIYGDKLKSSSLNSAIRRYNLDRGVNKTSIHLFRHTFAKKWILKGGDPFRLQKILGHSSMRMVKVYVNMFSNDLKENFDDYNPLEQFSKNNESIKLK